MLDGSADGPRKRKAEISNLDAPTQSTGHIKRLRSDAPGRDEGSVGQGESSVIKSIERDANADQREDVVMDSDADGDDERELTWSPSPDRKVPVARPTDSGGSRGKKAKGKARKKQSPPRRTMHNYYDGSHDGVVLIADLEQLRKVALLGTGATKVIFRTKAQFERHFGRPPTSQDMDDTCTITSFEPGIFRSKPRTWKMIEVEKQEDWRDEYQNRDWKFAHLMWKVGQTDKPFRERRVTGLLCEEMAKFKTPAGIRRRNQAYLEALKAGQYNPDALIRLENGTYEAIYFNLYEGTHDAVSFKIVTDKYGKDNVWLKTIDFDYMTQHAFDKNGTTFDAAEKMFCEYTGRTYEPNVFVRSSEGKWISKKQYDEKNRDNFDEDITQLEVLILGEYNQGFMQPKTMKWSNPKLYEQRMRAAHLTGYVPTTTQRSSSRGGLETEAISDILANKANRSSAPILLQISTEELEGVESIPPGVVHVQIYPQNVSEKSGFTGNYTRNWRSIRREEKFRDAGNDRHESNFEPSNMTQKPRRLMTDEQRRILKTPSPSPVQSDVSVDDELFVQRNSVFHPPETSDDDRTSLTSLPPDTSDDETPLPPVLGRGPLYSLPPDSSDDEPAALSLAQGHSAARSDNLTPRPSNLIQDPSLSPKHSAYNRWQTSGSPVARKQFAEAPQFSWASDSSDDEVPVSRWPTSHSPSENQAEESVGRGTSVATITWPTSRSSSLDDRRGRSRETGRD